MADSAQLVEQARAWYDALAPREQLLVRVGGAIAAVLVIVSFVMQMHGIVNRAEKRLASKRADVAYIASVLPELRGIPQPQGAGQSLVTVIDRTTKDAGLGASLKGADPSGIGGVRVRLEGAPFDVLVPWILTMERQYGLRVQQATVEKTDSPGRVNANLSLVPG